MGRFNSTMISLFPPSPSSLLFRPGSMRDRNGVGAERGKILNFSFKKEKAHGFASNIKIELIAMLA